MRLMTAMNGDTMVWGVRDGEELIDLSAQYPSPAALVAATPAELATAAADGGSPRLAVAALDALPPIPRPGKILCVGTNYADHVAESDSVTEAPKYPMLFVRFPESLVGHGVPIERPVEQSTHYDFEGELAIIVGRTARNVSPEEALDVIGGYAPFMDGTLRDFQRHTGQFTPGKNFDRSGAWGPEIVTSDEVGDPTNLAITTTVSGEVMQSANTNQLIHTLDRIVAYASSFITLHPGDVIATGTPGGVGYARTPPRLLVPRDTVDVTIERVGTLSNTVIDAG